MISQSHFKELLQLLEKNKAEYVLVIKDKMKVAYSL
jgi:hypothetical protein